MSATPVLTSMEKIEQWFDKNQLPYFTLYSGHQAGNNNVLFRNAEISDFEQAKSQLLEMLEMYTGNGGKFRLFVAYEPKKNWGLSTNIDLPPTDPNAAASRFRNPAIQGHQWQRGYGKEELTEEVQKQMMIYDLKRKVEDLEGAQHASIGLVDRFMENLVERPETYQVLQAVLVKIMGKFSGPQTAPQTAPIAGHDEPPANDGFDYDRIEPALEKIRSVFSEDLEGTIEKLADWVTDNPDMAKNLLGTI